MHREPLGVSCKLHNKSLISYHYLSLIVRSMTTLALNLLLSCIYFRISVNKEINQAYAKLSSKAGADDTFFLKSISTISQFKLEI